jgi:hypothetical protein
LACLKGLENPQYLQDRGEAAMEGHWKYPTSCTRVLVLMSSPKFPSLGMIFSWLIVDQVEHDSKRLLPHGGCQLLWNRVVAHDKGRIRA